MIRIVPLSSLFKHIDTRSVGDIERDLDDELAFHLDHAQARLVADGAELDDARAQALARFGDVHAIRSRCLRIALEDRIMLQRVHLAVTIVLFIGVLALGIGLVMAVRAQAAHREMAMVQAMQVRHQQEQVAHERERLDAVTDFLRAIIAGTDPAEQQAVTISELLERAEKHVATEIDDPDLAARLRAAIERARAGGESDSD